MKTTIRRLLFAALLPLPFLLAQDDAAQNDVAQDVTLPWTQLEGTEPAQWRVIWQEDPAHEATISWSTAEEGVEHAVHLSTKPGEGKLDTYPTVVSAQRNGQYTFRADKEEELPPAWYHHARIDGLEPSTSYWFVMVSEGVVSRELHFVTAPEDDRSIKLIYGGDSRSGLKARQQVNRMMAALTASDENILAFAHGGDYVYSGRLWGMWNTWLSHHELSTAETGRVLPIMPVRGNHDVGPLYNEIFDDPGGAEQNYYVTQLTPQIAILTLNSETSTTGDQAVFIEEALTALRPVNRWLLAQFHRPLYPAVKSPGAAKSTWVPLFEKYDVDLVLESDGHVLKRTVPIRGEKHDPSGVTYIGEGGLGVPQRTPDQERWYLKAPGMCASAHHVTVLEFSVDGLRMLSMGLPDAAESSTASPSDPSPAGTQASTSQPTILDDHRLLPRKDIEKERP